MLLGNFPWIMNFILLLENNISYNSFWLIRWSFLGLRFFTHTDQDSTWTPFADSCDMITCNSLFSASLSFKKWSFLSPWIQTSVSSLQFWTLPDFPPCITFGILFKGHNQCNFSAHLICLSSFREHCLNLISSVFRRIASYILSVFFFLLFHKEG